MSNAPAPDERPALLADAVAALRPDLEPGSRLIAAMGEETGLHPKALSGWLQAWSRRVDRAGLARLLASAQRPLDRGEVLTLAPGNVPVVAVECLLLGLLAGVRHTLALSTRARHLPRALAGHLAERWPGLEAWVDLPVWRELTAAEQAERLARAGRVVAYGTADTVEWLAGRLSSGSVLVPHGPSLSVGLVEPGALPAERLATALDGLAADAVAWDQRGCRCPHAVLVIGSSDDARDVARRLAEEVLPGLESSLPRGRLTEAEQTLGYLDGLTSRSLGTVWDGAAWRVTLEQEPRVLRPSPLGRTLRVIGLGDGRRVAELVATLPAPLGCLGTADGSPAPTALPEPLEVAALGTLQTAPVDRLHDGRHRLDELLPPAG